MYTQTIQFSEALLYPDCPWRVSVRCCFLQQCCLEQLIVLGCRKNRKLNAHISCHNGKPLCMASHTHIMHAKTTSKIMNIFFGGQVCVNDCVVYVCQVQVWVCVIDCSVSAIVRLPSAWRLHTITTQPPPRVLDPVQLATVSLILQHNHPIRTPARRAMKWPQLGLKWTHRTHMCSHTHL